MHPTFERPWQLGYLHALYVLAAAARTPSARSALAGALGDLALLWPNPNARQALSAALAEARRLGWDKPGWSRSALVAVIRAVHAALWQGSTGPEDSSVGEPPKDVAAALARYPAAEWYATPSLWGPHAWFLLHHLAEYGFRGYPAARCVFMDLVVNVARSLPCLACQKHAHSTLPSVPCDENDDLLAWTWYLREKVRDNYASHRKPDPTKYPVDHRGLREQLRRPHLAPRERSNTQNNRGTDNSLVAGPPTQGCCLAPLR